jgi:predicted O-linked N-acetylglucosamine transferase (SPINDLY family)
VSLEFKRYANHFHHLTGNVPANARFIKSLGLDALVYTDIGMSGRNYQYATMRLAPVQCTAWGHPITSGLPTIDYYLSSDLMEPENGQDHYREKLVRLPNSGLCYPRSSVPPLRMAKEDFGLDSGPLYLSCQNPMKYLPRWDFIYREICERTGRPIVFVESPSPLPIHIVRERVRAAGVNAIWLPGLGGVDFLNLVRIADVCLDTPGWNGGNTTIQALAEGRPIVTLPGDFMRGRHSLAFAQLANVSELVASGPDEFIVMACDLERCRAAVSSLQADNLFEDKKPVQALDSIFESICR